MLLLMVFSNSMFNFSISFFNLDLYFSSNWLTIDPEYMALICSFKSILMSFLSLSENSKASVIFCRTSLASNELFFNWSFSSLSLWFSSYTFSVSICLKKVSFNFLFVSNNESISCWYDSFSHWGSFRKSDSFSEYFLFSVFSYVADCLKFFTSVMSSQYCCRNSAICLSLDLISALRNS